MEIESIRHKALERFFTTGNSKGLVGDVNRLRKMFAFIVASGSIDELEHFCVSLNRRNALDPCFFAFSSCEPVATSLENALAVPPNYGLHPLKGDRAGSWAMTLSRNWRLTFRLNEAGALIDMDLEDYHGT